LTSFAAVTAPKNPDDNREREEKERARNLALREELSAAQRALLDIKESNHVGPEGSQALRLRLVNLFGHLERIQGQIDEASGGQAFIPNARGPTSPANRRRFDTYFGYQKRLSRLVFNGIELWALTCGMQRDDDWAPLVIVQMQRQAAAKAGVKANRAPKNGEDIREQDERGTNRKSGLQNQWSLAQRSLLEVIEHQQMGPGGLQATRFLLANLFARIERFQGQIDEAFGAQAFLTGAGGPTSPANLLRFNAYFEFHRKVSRLLFAAINVWAFTCSMKLDDDWVPIVIVRLHRVAATLRANANRARTGGEDKRDEEKDRLANRSPRKGLSAAQAYLLAAVSKKLVGPEGLQATQLHVLNLFQRIERFKHQIDVAFGGQLFLPDVGPTNPANINRFNACIGYHRKVGRLQSKAIEVWALTCGRKMDDDWTPIILVELAQRAALERSKGKRGVLKN
jgi:hypothetical protein